MLHENDFTVTNSFCPNANGFDSSDCSRTHSSGFSTYSIKPLTTLLHDTHDNVTKKHKDDIQSYRMEKIKKYKQKRTEELHLLLSHPLLLTRKEQCETYYDLFMDHATMDYIDMKKYWNCMKTLGYRFAQWNTTFHSYLFSMFATSMKTKLNVIEFIMSIIILRKEAEKIITYNTIIDDLLLHIKPTLHVWNQFPNGILYYTNVIMDGTTFTVGMTLQILYQLEKKLHNNKKMETEHTDMIKKLLYTLWEWV